MQYRELGSTGIMVSEIGFGAWGIGGDSYGPVDDNVAKKTLETAFDNGVNFFDTSDLYGKGHSEELIGDTFLNKRDKIIIATKFGALPHEGLIMKHDFSLKHIEESINKSLTRLKTDYIDIYQFHSPNLKKINMLDVLGFLKFCKLKGKIRNFGSQLSLH